MPKKIKYCKAWVATNEVRCTKKAMPGTVYCLFHYPKRALVLECIITFILTLILREMLLPKVWPFYHFLDKDSPIIVEIIPGLNQIKTVAKETKSFDVLFHEKDSGIDLTKSDIKVSFKDENTYKSLLGELKKTNSNLRFTLYKELKYGEYLLEVVLFDKANNKNERRLPFVVRAGDELTVSIAYDIYGNAPEADRNIFNTYIENKKDLLSMFKLYIYKLSIGNRDGIAILKDIYLNIDSSGGVFFYWEQIGNLNAKKVGFYGFPGAVDKRLEERMRSGQNLLNIEEIGPYGFVNFLMLVGESKNIRHSEFWEGVNIDGRYFTEGYGSSESREVHLRVSKKDFQSLK